MKFKRVAKRALSSGARFFFAGVVAALLATVGFVGTTFVIGSTLEQNPQHSMTADEREASEVLGRPLPRVTWMPANIVRSALTVDPEPEAVGNLPSLRFVYQSYSLVFENVAILRVNRGKLGRVGGGEAVLASGERIVLPEAQRMRVGTIEPLVLTTKLPQGDELVSYFLERDGLVIHFDVKLSAALDRATADRMFVSIR